MTDSKLRVLAFSVTMAFAIAMTALLAGHIAVAIVAWLTLAAGWLYLYYKYWRRDEGLKLGYLTATQWVEPKTGARIERTSRMEDLPKYAIRMHGNCLSKSGEWDLEPQPSNRDEAFLTLHRWNSLAGAEKALRQADYSPFFGAQI